MYSEGEKRTPTPHAPPAALRPCAALHVRRRRYGTRVWGWWPRATALDQAPSRQDRASSPCGSRHAIEGGARGRSQDRRGLARQRALASDREVTHDAVRTHCRASRTRATAGGTLSRALHAHLRSGEAPREVSQPRAPAHHPPFECCGGENITSCRDRASPCGTTSHASRSRCTRTDSHWHR